MRRASPRSTSALHRWLLAAPLLGLAASAHAPNPALAQGGGATLRAFRDEAELEAYHTRLVEAILSKPPLGSTPMPTPVPPPPIGPVDTTSPPPVPRPAPQPIEARIYGDPKVLPLGDYLLVLRQGRVVVVRVAGGALEPVAAVDALGPGVDREHATFFDLRASGDTVQVLAARASGGRTENYAASFRLDEGGSLEHLGLGVLGAESAIFDYRIVRPGAGGGLVFYHRVDLPTRDTAAGALAVLPSVRGPDGRFVTTATARRVYRSVFPMSWPHRPVLNVLTVCQPAPALECTSTALYTPAPTVMHVARNAVYLWTEYPFAVDDEDEPDRELLYRLPLDGSAPTALPVTGASIHNPEWFLESADGHLNAVVSHGGWTEEERSRVPEQALLRAPLSAFRDGHDRPMRQHYRTLPRSAGRYSARFVGEWLLYANRPSDPYLVESGFAGPTGLDALGIGTLRWADTTQAKWYRTRTPTLALEPLREDIALALVGSGDSTVLALLRLGGQLRVAGVPRSGINHWEGQIRDIAHRPDGPESGLLGIPVGVRPTEYTWSATAAAIVRYDSAGIRQVGEITPRGELSGRREVVPAFAHGRIFVLLGGEMVEAVEENGRLREVRRIQLP